VDHNRFEQTVERALASLPIPLQEAMDNVAIMIEEEDRDDPELYGLYRGTPLPDRSWEGYAGSLPDTISIFRRPLVEDFGGDEARLLEEIRVTVLHELAHHFGIDEEELVRLGWG
jgi:predicted Zn-dependent protease with MMP-like domain